jgi:phosphatidylserine decarboxylase
MLLIPLKDFKMDYLNYLLTRIAGKLASKRIPLLTQFGIKQFIKAYQVNMQEASDESRKAYDTFNAFFTRALKDGLRPVDTNEKSLVSPADGVVSEMGTIDQDRLIQAKGHTYTLEDLLAGDEQAAHFKNGFYSTVYLSPKDYHRVHMPLAGSCYQVTYVPGKLLPVKLKTAATVTNLFANNERAICYFDTDFGKMAVILVGATIVGSIGLAWQGIVNPTHKEAITTWHYDSPIVLQKGQEMGLFQLGSTVIILCENKPGAPWAAVDAKSQHLKYGEMLAELGASS